MTRVHRPPAWREVPAARQVDDETREHTEACESEAVMPSVRLCEYAGDQGGDQGTQVEGSIIDLEGRFAAPIITRIKVAHLRRQIAA